MEPHVNRYDIALIQNCFEMRTFAKVDHRSAYGMYVVMRHKKSDHIAALSIVNECVPVECGDNVGGSSTPAAPVAAASDDDGGDPDPEPARRRPHQHTFAPALLGFASVSHYVGFGRSRIYQLINAGEFPPPVKIGKSSRWVKAEVDAWIGSHTAQRKEARQ